MTESRRDLLTGAAAGLVGGLALAASLQVQGRNSMVAGLSGLATPGLAVAAQLLIAVLLLVDGLNWPYLRLYLA